MKNKNNNVDQEIEKTFEDFKHMEEIDTGEFLFTRIRAGINSPAEEYPDMFSVLKEKLLPAVLLFLIIINTVSIVFYMQSSDENTEVRTTYVSSFAQQYSLSSGGSDYLSTFVKGE